MFIYIHTHTHIHTYTYMGGGRNSRDRNIPCVARLTLSNKKTDVPFSRLIFSFFSICHSGHRAKRERESCVKNCSTLGACG